MERSYTKAKVIFYAPTHGGRPFVPTMDGYAPYLRVANCKDDLAVRLNRMPHNGNFGVEYEAELELSYHPTIDYSLLVEGTRFVLIEGPKTIGEGVVTSAIYCRRPELPKPTIARGAP